LFQQALHVLPMLIGTQFIMLVARLLTGAEFPGLLWFLGSFVGAVLWYPMTYVLLLPQFQPMERDHTRPI
jgi:rod shape-determining protein MreD